MDEERMMLREPQQVWKSARNWWNGRKARRRRLCVGHRYSVVSACAEILEPREVPSAAPAFRIPSNPDPLRSLGPQSTLVVQVSLSGDAGTYYSDDDIKYVYSQVNDFYTRQSFGKLTFPEDRLTIVPDVVDLPLKVENLQKSSKGPDQIVKAVESALTKQGYKLKDYLHLTIIHPFVEGKAFDYAGLGLTPGNRILLNDVMYLDPEVWAHELGHNAGAPHAGVFDPKDASLSVADAKQMKFSEDSTWLDVMDSKSFVGIETNGDMFALRKAVFGWLDAKTNIANVTSSGTFRLYATDDGMELDNQNYALRIRRNATQEYWVEYRGSSLTESVKNGVIVTLYDNGGAKKYGLLDMTPGSIEQSDPASADEEVLGPSDFDDPALEIGHTFDDFAGKVRITPLSTNSTDDGRHFIDVVVSVGDELKNHPPTVTLSSDDESSSSDYVQFTAAAQDVDGDHLTYSWSVDGVEQESVESSAVVGLWGLGPHVVRVSVNDGHGGISDCAQVINDSGSDGGDYLSLTPLTKLERVITKEKQGSNVDVVVASDGQQRSVVVWVKEAQLKEHVENTIVAQRFEGAQPIGPEITVGQVKFGLNEFREFSTGVAPKVSMANNGQFVVAWSEDHPVLNTAKIFSRTFTSFGEPLEEATLVADGQLDNLFSADVAIAPDGQRFVVSWSTELAPEFRVFNDKGDAITDAISVLQPQDAENSDRLSYSTGNSTVTIGTDGQFVICWQWQSPDDGENWCQFFAQRFQINGTAVGSPLPLSNHEQWFGGSIQAEFSPDGSLGVVGSGNAKARTPVNLFVLEANDHVLIRDYVGAGFGASIAYDDTGHLLLTWINTFAVYGDGQVKMCVFSHADESLSIVVNESEIPSGCFFAASAALNSVSGFLLVTEERPDPDSNAHPFLRVLSLNEADRIEAQADVARSPLNKPVTVFVTGNDSHSGSGPLTLSVPFAPQLGSVSINNNKTPSNPADDRLVFAPQPGVRGIEDIVYQLTNDAGEFAYGILRVLIGDPNFSDASISVGNSLYAVPDSFSIKEDVTFKSSGSGVLRNDALVNQVKLKADLIHHPTHGKLTFNANGSFTFVPDLNWSGTDSFDYRVTDGKSFSQPVTVTLNVIPQADKPTLTLPKPLSVPVGQDIALPISVSLADRDSETLLLKLSGIPMTVTLNKGHKFVDGTWRLTANDLIGLSLTGTAKVKFTLKVECLSAESLGGSIARTTGSLSVAMA